MGIRRSGRLSGSILLHFAVVSLIVPITANTSLGRDRSTEALIATYDLPPTISAGEAESAVARLEKSLAQCNDGYLAARIRYRMGVLLFKAGILQGARTRFLQVANDSNCPELVRVCGLNMAGQISRMLGEDQATLDAFGRVAALAEKQLSSRNRSGAGSAFKKLWCTALFARAELFETRHNGRAAIAEYKHLIEVVTDQKDPDVQGAYAPVASDRLCQLYLRRGDVETYLKAAARLVVDYPRYYRTPLVEFESECIRFLEGVAPGAELINGSFGAPAQAIGCVKDKKAETSGGELKNVLERLCRKHEVTYGGIMLQYHLAWLLDVLGEKDKAVEVLARVASADVQNAQPNLPGKLAVETFQEYAKIESALMLTERADYLEALRALGALREHPESSHLSQLAKSVSEAIQILRREVPGNESR